MLDYKDFEVNKIAKSKLAKGIIPKISPNGDFTELEGKDCIINSIRTLLMTPLGNYPFDPQYGSLLYNQLFEFQDSITQDKIMYEVKNRIRMYEPRASVEDVQITMNNKVANVDVYLIIDNDNKATKLSIQLSKLDSVLVDDNNETFESPTIWSS